MHHLRSRTTTLLQHRAMRFFESKEGRVAFMRELLSITDKELFEVHGLCQYLTTECSTTGELPTSVVATLYSILWRVLNLSNTACGIILLDTRTSTDTMSLEEHGLCPFLTVECSTARVLSPFVGAAPPSLLNASNLGQDLGSGD